MNELELQRLYEAQLTAQIADERIPAHDRSAAVAVLEASGRLLGARLPPADEHRTWVFSDPHFEHEASVAIFGRPFRHCHHGDGYLLEQWTRDVLDHDTVICLGDVTMNRPTDGLIDRLRRRPGRKILVAGNHDNAHIRRLRRGFDEVAACAHLRGKPHLLFTHVPLGEVPAGCVNVHGHVHRKTSVDERRINVCVEQIGYRLIPRGGRDKAGLPLGPGALGRERHDRPLHRLGKGLGGCRKSRRSGRRTVTGTPDTVECGRAAVEPRGRPTLEPDEKLWLEKYLERLKRRPTGSSSDSWCTGRRRGATPDRRAMSMSWCSSERPRTPYGTPGT